MAEAFFSLYCLVKNTRPPKVFFKFFKDHDLFIIYPKTAQNALEQCLYILEKCEFLCSLEGTVREYSAGTELLTKYVMKSMNESN